MSNKKRHYHDKNCRQRSAFKFFKLFFLTYAQKFSKMYNFIYNLMGYSSKIHRTRTINN